MEIEILFDKNGLNLNGIFNLLQPFVGFSKSAATVYFKKQITVEFYDSIIVLSDGSTIVDFTSAVTTGLSGTLNFTVKPTVNSPFIITLPGNGNLVLNDNENVIQFEGRAQNITMTSTNPVGFNYVKVIFTAGI